MSDAITFIILFAIYAISAGGVWLHFHFSFSKGGMKEGEELDPFHLIFVFFPGLNTIGLVISLLFLIACRRNGEPRITLNHFFGIKK
jgi:hypothetical protein